MRQIIKETEMPDFIAEGDGICVRVQSGRFTMLHCCGHNCDSFVDLIEHQNGFNGGIYALLRVLRKAGFTAKDARVQCVSELRKGCDIPDTTRSDTQTAIANFLENGALKRVVSRAVLKYLDKAKTSEHVMRNREMRDAMRSHLIEKLKKCRTIGDFDVAFRIRGGADEFSVMKRIVGY